MQDEIESDCNSFGSSCSQEHLQWWNASCSGFVSSIIKITTAQSDELIDKTNVPDLP